VPDLGLDSMLIASSFARLDAPRQLMADQSQLL
jgi:hypothetical protein